MYKYFVPDASEPDNTISQAPSVDLLGDIVPLYNEQGDFKFVLFFGVSIYSNIGEVMGYIRKPKVRLDKSIEFIKQQSSSKTF